jgi:hypothetical protein
MYGRESNACKILIEKREEKNSLGRPGRRWEDNGINFEDLGVDGRIILKLS